MRGPPTLVAAALLLSSCVPNMALEGESYPLSDDVLFVGRHAQTLETSIYRVSAEAGRAVDLLDGQLPVLHEDGAHIIFTPEAPYPRLSLEGRHMAYLAQTASPEEGMAERVVVVRSADDGALEAQSAPVPGLFNVHWHGAPPDPGHTTERALLLERRDAQSGRLRVSMWLPGTEPEDLLPEFHTDLRLESVLEGTSLLLMHSTVSADSSDEPTGLLLVDTDALPDEDGAAWAPVLEQGERQSFGRASVSEDRTWVAVEVQDLETGRRSIVTTQLPTEGTVIGFEPPSDITRLVGFNAYGPQWRPLDHEEDPLRLAYILDPDLHTADDEGVFQADLDGRNRIDLNGAFDGSRSVRNPRWSPTGRRLLIDYQSVDADDGEEMRDLWIIDADTLAARKLTGPGDPRLGVRSFAHWHRRGDLVLFQRADSDGSTHLVLSSTRVEDFGRQVELAVPEDVAPTFPLFVERNTLLY
jgi:hypothetical protein